MENPTSVRLADLEDVENLYWHLMGDLEADNSLGIPENPRKVLGQVMDCCQGDGAIAGIIDGPNGTILGSIGIRAVEPWFSEQTILSQVWLFVSPSARKGSHLGEELFEFAEWHRQDMSRRVGYDMVFENTVWSLHRLPAKIRLWSRFGQQIGATFWSKGTVDEHREDFEQEQHDGSDGPIGPVGLPEPLGAGPADSEHAVPRLHRPTRSAAE